MKLKQVSYSNVINGNHIVIIESNMVNEKYINLKDKGSDKAIQLGDIVRLEPMPMQILNNVIRHYFNDIEYIDLMSTAKIHKVI